MEAKAVPLSSGNTVEVKCAWCKEIFTAKKADRKRGWAKCCDKSCASKKRTYGKLF